MKRLFIVFNYMLIISLWLISFSSCKNIKNYHLKKKIKKNIEDVYQKKIIINDSLKVIINKNEINIIKNLSYFNTRYKILNIINGDCISCINSLNKWENIIKEFKMYDVSFLFIIKTKNINWFIKNIYSDILLNYPLIIDDNNFFYNENNYLKDCTFQTFGLDSDLRITIAGSPTENPKLKEIYKKLFLNKFE